MTTRRRHEALELRRRGLTIDQIAWELQITRERARQLVLKTAPLKHGPPNTPGHFWMHERFGDRRVERFFR